MKVDEKLSPNFRVVDGSPVEVVFEDFEKDYLDPLVSSDELFQKYHLSRGVFRKLCKQIREKHGLMRKPRNAKHYSRFKNTYSIRKSSNLKSLNYGSIPVGREDLLEEALQICEEHNWEYPLCRELIEELKG